MSSRSEFVVTRLIKRSVIVNQPIKKVFDFFSDATNLEVLTPHWLHFKIISSLPIKMGSGTVIEYKLKVKGLPISWRSEILDWNPPFIFVDSQINGPYEMWVHTHRFTELKNVTRLDDEVIYKVPGDGLVELCFRNRWSIISLVGYLLQLVTSCVALIVRRDLDKIFDYRTRKLQKHFGIE